MNFCRSLIIVCSILPLSILAQLDSTTLSIQKTYFSLSDALQQPDSVYKLNISKKKIKTWPNEIYKFKNLQVLNISKNDLTTLPDSIYLLNNLQVLIASNNKLTAIPANIGALKGLTHINFNRNLIVTIPVEIGNLQALEVLEMWDNELDTIPDEIKNLGNLRILELRGILFSEDDQRYIKKLVPHAHVYFSPWCACANKF
ncbi:MAG: leucine-rich repeat domain-containing protein [Bacteroidia bacterium]|nr:leucine-rich repeat domain-containing protein [Bacteroidia bacterium]HQV00841.1 leucine-rich repeat domain-containing protein [Bacteroidia bacterium]